jgi:hypothetical protein
MVSDNIFSFMSSSNPAAATSVIDTDRGLVVVVVVSIGVVEDRNEEFNSFSF